MIAIKPDGPLLRGRDRDRDRHRRLRRQPRHSATPAAAPDLAHQLEPVHRNLAQPALRARQPRRLAVDAGHFLVLVLRRDVPDAVCQLHARTFWAATSTSRRCCSRSSRSASASARCCASGCRATRSRSDWSRSARSGCRSSPSTCISRAAVWHPAGLAGVDAFLRVAGALAHRRRPDLAGDVRRLLHRAAAMR